MLARTRVFDVVTATVLVIATLPVMVLAALAVALTSSGPALYSSWRLGQGGTMFRCVKFRTMHNDADTQLPHLLASNEHLAHEFRFTQSLKNDPRVTTVGAFLRRTRIDELPLLFCVLSGSMSLVGPRPIMPKEIQLYGPALTTTLEVKPGAIAPWQVGSRHGGYTSRIAHDEFYVATRSIPGDLVLCARAVLCVLRCKRA